MQSLIPYVWQMVFANIFVKGWIINSDIQSLFYIKYCYNIWHSICEITKPFGNIICHSSNFRQITLYNIYHNILVQIQNSKLLR